MLEKLLLLVNRICFTRLPLHPQLTIAAGTTPFIILVLFVSLALVVDSDTVYIALISFVIPEI